LSIRRPGWFLLALVGVFAPMPLAMLLAEWLQMDALALAGVVVSVALASLMLRARGTGWTAVGLHRGIAPGRLLLTVLPAVAMLLLVNAFLSSLPTRL
jgi:hypothetical protein